MGLPISSEMIGNDRRRGDPQEKKAIASPLVKAIEKGTGQIEPHLRGMGDVRFGLGFDLTNRPEVCWKAAQYRVTAP